VGFFLGDRKTEAAAQWSFVKQPIWAPAAFGGSIVTGIAAALISGYEIVDCLQYRTKQGECSDVISRNAVPLVAGFAAIAGPLAGFFTYNATLESPRTGLRRQWDEYEPEPEPEPEPEIDNRAVAAKLLRAEGLTQQAIADQLGVSRSTVQRLLQS
jgi:hypothetical protein